VLLISCHKRRRHRGKGAFLPNWNKSGQIWNYLGNIEIIWALKSSLKVKICLKTFIFGRNSLIQDLFEANHYLKSLCFCFFFWWHSLISDFFWLHLCKYKNIRANFVPPSNWYCLLWLCFMHYFNNFEIKFFKLFATVYFFKYWLFITWFLIFIFLKCHRNRLFLQFFGTYRISIYSLLFRVSIPNPA